METRLQTRSSEHEIRRLLRRTNSQEYLSGQGWTRDPCEATTFSDVLEAAQTCIRRDLHGVELALRVEPDACDVFCTPLS